MAQRYFAMVEKSDETAAEG
jgi:hypothetical protein